MIMVEEIKTENKQEIVEKKEKKDIGRPSEMTEERVNKLKQVFAMDGTVDEACFYAEISKQTYYNWLEKKPELVDEIEALRNKPVLKARKTIYDNLDNINTAQWFAERNPRMRKDFSATQRIEVSGEIENIHTISPKLLEIKDKYEKELFESTAKEWDKQEVKIEQKIGESSNEATK